MRRASVKPGRANAAPRGQEKASLGRFTVALALSVAMVVSTWPVAAVQAYADAVGGDGESIGQDAGAPAGGDGLEADLVSETGDVVADEGDAGDPAGEGGLVEGAQLVEGELEGEPEASEPEADEPEVEDGEGQVDGQDESEGEPQGQDQPVVADTQDDQSGLVDSQTDVAEPVPADNGEPASEGWGASEQDANAPNGAGDAEGIVTDAPAEVASLAKAASVSALDEVEEEPAEEPEPAFDMSAYSDALANVRGGDLYFNRAADADRQQGLGAARTLANAAVSVGEGRITVSVPLLGSDMGIDPGTTLGSAEGVETSVSGGVATVVITAKPGGAGTQSYELSGSDARFSYGLIDPALASMGATALDPVELEVELTQDQIDRAWPAEEPAQEPVHSSVESLNPFTTYSVPASLFVREGDAADGSPIVLGSVDGVTDGQKNNLSVLAGGVNALSLSHAVVSDFGTCGNAAVSTQELSGFSSSNFALGDYSGVYEFTGATVELDGSTYSNIYLWVDFEHATVASTTIVSGNEAPYSGLTSDLAPGTYTVTANLYVPGELNPVLVGLNAYPTNGHFPPTSPVLGNATLTVGEDGGYTLDVDIDNKVFIVKQVAGEGTENSLLPNGPGTGATVTSAAMDSETYSFSWSEATGTFSTTGRVTHLTVSLTDVSTGQYYFNDCKEYPLVFGADWSIDLGLRVDLANAVSNTGGDDADDELPYPYAKTFTSSDGALSLSVETTSKKEAALLEGAIFSAERIGEGEDAYSDAQQQLSARYSAVGETVENPPLVIYDVALTDALGNDIDFSKLTKSAYTCKDASFEPINGRAFTKLVFDYAGGVLSGPPADGGYSRDCNWDSDYDGTFVIYVVRDNAYPTSFSYTDGATGASIYGQTVTNMPMWRYMAAGDFEIASASDLGAADDAALRSAIAAVDGSAGGESSIETLAVALKTIEPYSHSGDLVTYTYPVAYTIAHTSVTYAIPAAKSNSSLYLIDVAADGTVKATAAADLPGSPVVSQNGGLFTLTWDADTHASDVSANMAMNSMFQRLYYAVTGYTDAHAYAYFAVVAPADADILVAKPDASAAASGLVYNGAEQTGVALGEGYAVTGGSATGAGDYVATVAPAEGYCWTDGTKDPVQVSWSIAKASLTARYAGEGVTPGFNEPEYKVEVTGFLGDDTEDSAAGYVRPTVEGPAQLETGIYELTPAGGSADNYSFSYVGGTLTVYEPSTYAVTANLWLAVSDASAAGFPVLESLAGADGAAYMTNPDNPMGIGGHNGLPTKPVSRNATVTVAHDGTMRLTVPVSNPVFTLQKVGSNDELGEIAFTTVDGDFGGAPSRVDSITVTLPAGISEGDWVLSGSQFRPAIQAVADIYGTMTVPLHLTVGDLPTPQPEPTPDQPVAVSAPAGAELTYTGAEQQGVASGEGYTLSGAASAKDAGEYEATAALAEGYVWDDGTSEPKTVAWSIAKAPLTASYLDENVALGTEPSYQVTVTGFVGGETAATAEGYQAPTVAAPAELAAGESYQLTPAGGSAKNYAFAYVPGTLTVSARQGIAPGTYTVDANLWLAASDASAAGFPLLATLAGADGAAYMTNPMNPMGAGGAAVGVPTSPVTGNATLVVAEDGTMTLTVPVSNPVFTLQRVGSNDELGQIGQTAVEGDFGGAASRIDSITVTLPQGKASGDWVLEGSQFRPAIGAVAATYGTITVPLHLTVGGTEGLPSADGSGKTIDNGGQNQNQNNGQSQSQGQNSQNGQGMRLAAGTYTVTANIWLSDRSATGLPLMPYLTSAAFPPMYPVTGNATLTVDESGHAWVRVPIQIQPRIMEVSGVGGLNVTNVEYGANGVSAVTVDLGVVTDLSGVITQGCTVSITMGSLASTISGITGAHTWPATFQVVFSGVPVSANSASDVPESVRQALANGGLAAGEGSLAAAGTGTGATLEFLSVAVDGASDAMLAASQGSLEPSQAMETAQKGAAASASKALRALDPDVSDGTSATTALAMAAALGGASSDGSLSSGQAQAQGRGALAAALLGDAGEDAA